MKKIYLLLLSICSLAACNINTPEPMVEIDENAYEAYGLLTIPHSGFTKENVRVQMIIKDENVMDLYMYEVKFASAMPVTIDMLVSNVPYSQTNTQIDFYGDSIIPTAGGKPYEKYIVRELQGTITEDSIILSNYYGSTFSTYEGKLKIKN